VAIVAALELHELLSKVNLESGPRRGSRGGLADSLRARKVKESGIIVKLSWRDR
jgi:hypothetical protein